MVEKMKENYFSIMKFCCLTVMLAYVIVDGEKSFQAISQEGFWLGLFLAVSTLYELLDKEKLGCLLAEIIFAIGIFVLFRVCLKTQNAGHFDKSQIAAM